MLSGANTDDLGEYRPGLAAAEENNVRHPYIEARLGKNEIRAAARHLGLDFAELPASPCLASRLYTGTAVTPARLRSIEVGEDLLRMLTGISVVRCRLREDTVLVEVTADEHVLVTDQVLDQVAAAMRRVEPSLLTVCLDEQPYRPGRAIAVLT
jgi:pyridinium-3,5-biscarboxylic acid mononucleotide sulfurtransferase